MKRNFYSIQNFVLRLALAVCLFCAARFAVAADAVFVNTGNYIAPPESLQIDAVTFSNAGYFSVSAGYYLVDLGPPSVIGYNVFQFTDTVNFINRNQMVGTGGFEFDTIPLDTGVPQRGGSFVNENPSPFGAGASVVAQAANIIIDCTNVVNRGLLQIGSDGLLSVSGSSVDLTRSTLTATNVFLTSGIGQLATYWGNSNAPPKKFSPAAQFNTNNFYVQSVGILGTNFLPYALNTNVYIYSSGFLPSLFMPASTVQASQFVNRADPSNATVQVILVNNPNTNFISASLQSSGFFGLSGLDELLVQASLLMTNVSGQPYTNYLNFVDDLGINFTNAFIKYRSGFGGTRSRPVYEPTNYTVFSGQYPYLGNFGAAYNPSIVVGTNATVSNYFQTAFGMKYTALSVLPNPPQTIPDLPGRVEVHADKYLDINRVSINAMTYTKIEATNHIASVTNSAIATPYCDIALASTNGSLTLQGLLKPVFPVVNGTVGLYSVIWTNDSLALPIGSTNYVKAPTHVFMVDLSGLATTVPVYTLNLNLRATNLFLGDIFNVTTGLNLDADTLNISSNAAINSSITYFNWKDQVPYLRSMTNAGVISSVSGTGLYFIGKDRTTLTSQPYYNFVNLGSIASPGEISVSSQAVTNNGSMTALAGVINIDSATNVWLGDQGYLLAPLGDVRISCGSLFATNHTITAARSLTLYVTNSLQTATNYFVVGNGINLPLPPVGDFRLTTISNVVQAGVNQNNLWSGVDVGAVNSGFTNNGAIGRLILDGAAGSVFTFTGTGSGNAIYVDSLELLDNATNVDSNGNLSELAFPGDLIIYYSQALANGVSRAEKYNHKNGDHLRWIPTYAGVFSSTNVVEFGVTNTVNAALAASKIIDSDADGVPNYVDPTPFFVSPEIHLTIGYTNLPPLSAKLTWTTIPLATNYVQFRTNMFVGAWTGLTNFVSPQIYNPNPPPGDNLQQTNVCVYDPVNLLVPRYYRVIVQPWLTNPY